MAEITLRSYSQEVDGLIELEQLDEAIAHCRQILQAFPKHLDTYRSLGKAYLEAKRYGDASDIFQRVLSSEPADFVSHIGMSVIREDAGNLDSSIWHMERAFENNPANQIIQQELKRLFGQRDGSEPTKVRLTRGALARMYANGELYPQAVAELRAALDEDPERADLRILLAEMHWQLNQQLEAAEICSQVLEKLPHCREANRIMAAVLQAGGKSDAASVYLRRLAAIDPYTAFLESPADDIALVDADSVTLEKLEWQAGEEIEEVVRSKPDWATSLGTEDDIDDTGSVDTAEWRKLVSALPTEDEEMPEELADTSSLETSEDDAAIPEWLREGGWNEATGEATEEPISFSDEEIAMLEAGMPADANLARADIPEWLKDIAPVSVTDPDASDTTERVPTPPDESTPEEGERELPDWLAGIAEDVRREEEEAEPTPPFDDDQPEEEIVVPEAPPEPAAEAPAEPTAETPSEPVAEAPPEPVAEAPAEPVADERRQLPTWLEDSEPGGAETILTWLGSRDQPDDPDDETAQVLSTDRQPDAADTSSWLNGVAEAAAQEQPAEGDPLSGLDTGEDRLDPTKAVTRELSPEMLERFVRPPAVEDVEAEEIPEAARWEPEFEEQGVSAPASEPPTTADEPTSGTLTGEGIEWLDTLAGLRPPEPPPEEEPEVPTWLRELAPDTDDLPGEETLVVPAAQEPEEPEEPPVEIEPPAEVPEPVAEAAPPADVPEAVAEPEPPAHEASTIAEFPEPVPPFIEEPPEGEMPESEPLPEAAETPDIPTPIEEPPESVVAESAPVPEAADVPDVPTSIEEAPADVKPSSSHKLSEEQAAEKLATARIALESGDVQTAANEYQALIRAKYHLNEVIDTLQRALERYPNTPILWQVLGDAHMKADQLTDAMDAYRQGLDTI